jgi:phosphoribosylformylglycinamidine synthase
MPKKPTAAVLMFPGTNCELEAAAALTRNGFITKILRWNEANQLKKFDAAVLAGGFSYEDRGRSGLIASHDPALKEMEKMVRAGKPVLGICNGAQILVESGLVPLGKLGQSTLALTHNRRADAQGKILGTGFYNAWIQIRAGSEQQNAFNQFDANTILKIPAAHGEGRFFSGDADLLTQLVANGQNAFVYCTESGELDPSFPTNPNGSVLNFAGVTNPDGNCLALMPHPERAEVGDAIFKSMFGYLTNKNFQFSIFNFKTISRPKISNSQKQSPILPKPRFAAEIFVSLQITDNEALSVEAAAREAGAQIQLKKWRWFGFSKQQTANSKQLESLIRSGDLLNPEKETAVVKIAGKFFRFDKVRGLVPTKFSLSKLRVLAVERGSKIQAGTIWAAEVGSASAFEKAIKEGFFHSAAAQDLVKI